MLAGLNGARLLLALDYDGTLAPIVADPERATPDPRGIELLSELSHRVRQLAIISGRDTDFLAARLPLPHALLVGNHGLEERREGQSRVIPEAIRYLDAVQRAADALARIDTVPGTMLERKQVTLAVHFRQSENPLATAERLRPLLMDTARANELALKAGRLVFELRPPIAVDKGAVLKRLAASIRPQSVIYAGDDRTDLDAFGALRAMSASGLHTISVGVSSAELPADTFRDCDVIVDGVPGVVDLLSRLRDVLAA